MATTLPMAGTPTEHQLLPLDSYDKIFVAFSGGKDSLALVLHLLELGVPKDRIELWHHLVDGAPGSDSFMDWPVTDSYCQAVARELGIPLRRSWKDGGFEGEMLREMERTKPTSWEATDGTIMSAGGTRGKLATRRMFPQVSADLSVRWCSAYCKVDVARAVLCNDPAYKPGGTFLILTGERREESAARAKYREAEAHKATNKSRRVDQWRAVIDWTEEEVWAIIERWGINPHPAYRLGWGRLSCRQCIFGSADQWASIEEAYPDSFYRVAEYEEEFGKTIQRNESVIELAARGTSYLPDDQCLIDMANSEVYTDGIFVQQWELPAGAYKNTEGPS